MKWFFVMVCFALIFNLALGDPFELHRIDLSVAKQTVVNVAYNISHGEYQHQLESELHRR
jgi:hypothetical protein